MKNWKDVPFDELLAESRDGEWGLSQPEVGHTEAVVVRGTDFSGINDPGQNLPHRWIKDHLVERKRLQPGDIVFEMAGGTSTQSTGRTALLKPGLFERNAPLPILCASFSRHLRLDFSRFCPEFVYYFLQTLHRSGYMGVFHTQHTGVARFQYSSFKKHTTLKIPDFLVQRKIAAILTAYDDLIDTNKRRITLLEKMAEEIYCEWFVRMRFPGYQNARFIKGVPEGWAETQFSKIAIFAMGQSPKSEFYNQVGEGLPFHQGVGSYGNRFPNTATYCSVSGRKAKKGDILFSVRAPVGRLNIADQEMVIGRGLAAISHKEGQNSYLYYALKSIFKNEDIIGNGAIFNSVGRGELSRFLVYLHPKRLVEEFECVVRPIDNQIEKLTSINASLVKTRDLLLPRLISGKLSVEDLDIQFPLSMRDDSEADDRLDKTP